MRERYHISVFCHNHLSFSFFFFLFFFSNQRSHPSGTSPFREPGEPEICSQRTPMYTCMITLLQCRVCSKRMDHTCVLYPLSEPATTPKMAVTRQKKRTRKKPKKKKPGRGGEEVWRHREEVGSHTGQSQPAQTHGQQRRSPPLVLDLLSAIHSVGYLHSSNGPGPDRRRNLRQNPCRGRLPFSR